MTRIVWRKGALVFGLIAWVIGLVALQHTGGALALAFALVGLVGMVAALYGLTATVGPPLVRWMRR